MSTSKKILLGLVGLLALVGFFFVIVLGWRFLSSARDGGIAPLYGKNTGGFTPSSMTLDASQPDYAPYASKNLLGSREDSAGASAQEGSLTLRKVVRNGQLEMLVDKAEEVSDKIQGIALSFGGFVQDANVYEIDEKTKNGMVVIRVPADKFDQAMTEIKKLGIRVESESISAQDVTEQFIDFEAQLKNYRLEEQQYQEVLKKAQKVDEILSVHSQLARVRGDIERTEGQLKYLSRQVDMSSIEVSLTAESEVTVLGVRWRPLYEMKLALRSMLESLTSFVDMLIALVIYLPIIAIWLAFLGFLFWLGRKIWRWAREWFV